MRHTGFWALVEDGVITLVIDGVPRRWRNIHAFDELAAWELADLSWAGHQATSFLPVRGMNPSFNSETHEILSPEFALEAGYVQAHYTFVERPQPPTLQARLQTAVSQIPVTTLGGKRHAEPRTPEL